MERIEDFTMKTLLLLTLVTFAQSISYCNFTLSTKNLLLELEQEHGVDLEVTCFNETDEYNTILEFLIQNKDIVNIEPPILLIDPVNSTHQFFIEAASAGHTEVVISTPDDTVKFKPLYLIVNVFKHHYLDILSKIFGWIYILSWGASYYPQIFLNYKRKSVIGLNFDFVALNIVGYCMYGIFILNVFFVEEIQDEYFRRHPRGLIPVKINDVVYNIHGISALIVTVIQCFVYEKGNQIVTMFGRVTLTLIFTFSLIIVILAGLNVIEWLDFLYYCSYNKVIITALKYIPQAYMNYKRKSTQGWSIGLVILQLSGGIFSVLQMILDSYNYNDWVSIFGNPTKFLAGMLNILFPTYFVIQHYVLYRPTPIINKV